MSDDGLADGVGAYRRGDYAAAARLFQAAAARAPQDHRPLANLAAALRKLDRPDEAEAALRQAVALEPRAALAWETLGNLLKHQARLEAAAEAYRAALAAEPRRAASRWGLALSLLGLGDRAGWEPYEARVDVPELKIARPPGEPWSGEIAADRPVCIWPEQGFGDQIMASRFAALLQARGAPAAVYAAPALQRLLQAMGLDVHGLSPAVLPPGGRTSLWLSLPRHLGVEPAAPPPPLPLRVTPRGRGGVGVMTAGNPEHANDANRSMPADAAARLRALPGAVDLSPAATGARDFLETAEIVAGLDGVITVDTAVAHLAGAVGTPTWVLLPSEGVDWRWLTARPDSPWYPSLNLVRRTPAETWHDAIDRALSEAGVRA